MKGAALVLLLACAPAAQHTDWLVQPIQAKAECVAEGGTLVLRNGLVARTIRIADGVATIALDQVQGGASLVRAVEPEALVTIDGKAHAIGGLDGQPDRAYLAPHWLGAMRPRASAFAFAGHEQRAIRARCAWQRVRHAEDRPWPPPGVELVLRFARADGVQVDVHHEIYAGLPLLSKWLSIRNASSEPIQLARCVVERLALVEGESSVEKSATDSWTLPNVSAVSEYSFHDRENAFRYVRDERYTTQVSYRLQTPCVLEAPLALGERFVIPPGGSFESFRTYLLVHDSTERERRGLAIRRMWRTLAPWCTENPILMHVRSAEPAAVKLAIDQCAEVGFEMVILTFGSGFEIERDEPAYLTQLKALAQYAHGKGIELGGYGLLASRSISKEHDVVVPNGAPIFGASPCLCSAWGRGYFTKLTAFFASTGFDALEHDGSYPGDTCASITHPGHTGLGDSQWLQWRAISDFYRAARARGTYLNVPDWYFLSGASKCAMGYRETNWSLPRDQQVIHARQNIFDGTWEKTPSMGWMFVPLVEYQGGGAAATIEPLKDHLDVYEQHLANCFGLGVQACWRGPRLFDCDATKALVAKWVAFFKQHRAILESDLIHVRRADGRDVDCMVHVNAALKERALALFFNPLPHEVERKLTLPLRYAGLPDREVNVKVPARGVQWLVIEAQ